VHRRDYASVPFDRTTQTRGLRPQARRFTVHLVQRRPSLAQGTTMGHLADDVATAIRGQFGGPVPVLGTSTGGSVALQLAVDQSMRARVMALWAVAFLGTTPIGGPIVGYVCQHASPRWGLAIGGLAALTATALAGFPHLRRAWNLNRESARPPAPSV